MVAAHPIVAERPTSTTLWFDCTDILRYAEAGNRGVSGIQRLVVNLYLHALECGMNLIPVIVGGAEGRLVQTNPHNMRSLMTVMQSGRASRQEVRTCLAQIRESLAPTSERSGDVLVIAGAFWIYGSHDVLIRLRMRGLSIVLFIHDLIQWKHPDYFPVSSFRPFMRSLVEVLAVTDLILTHSTYVRGEIEQFLQDHMGFTLPVFAIPLATELPERTARTSPVDDAVAQIAHDDYVLCVGTIEVRKNHLYLLRIWERLAATMPSGLPKLVFVGKLGWEIDPLRAYVEQSGCEGRWLSILHEVSDADLALLYQNCLMTLYPSLAEGWGLPIGESLAHGKPCVASNGTSLPEVGGALVRYVDPLDIEGGYHVIRALLEDRQQIVRWSDRIRAEFVPRSWASFSADLFATIDRIAAPPVASVRLSNSVCRAGELHAFGNRDLAEQIGRGGRIGAPNMGLLEGWSPVDEASVTSRGARAALGLRTDLSAGTDVFLYLKIDGPALLRKRPLRVEAGASEHRLLIGPAVTWHRVGGRIKDGGVLNIDLALFIADAGSGAVGLRFRLHALGFSPADSHDLRLAVVEAIAMEQADARPVEAGALGAPDESWAAAIDFQLRLTSRFGRDLRFGGLLRRLRLWRARRAARRSDWRAAEGHYAALLRADPFQARLWSQYGHALKEQGRLDAALRAYRLAILYGDDAEGRLHYNSTLETLPVR